jgi:gluconokinase
VLPHWVTERAPTWPDNLQGTITGLTQTTTAADLLRALTTSTFYRLADILDLIDQHQNTRAEVIVSGGILKSPKLVQILADACGRDLRISRELETSIRGAAIHALEQLGYKTNSPQLGRIAKHSASLTAKHLVRRERQRELEQLFTKLSS